MTLRILIRGIANARCSGGGGLARTATQANSPRGIARRERNRRVRQTYTRRLRTARFRFGSSVEGTAASVEKKRSNPIRIDRTLSRESTNTLPRSKLPSAQTRRAASKDGPSRGQRRPTYGDATIPKRADITNCSSGLSLKKMHCHEDRDTGRSKKCHRECPVQSKRLSKLSITHIFTGHREPDFDVREPGHTTPNDNVTWRAVAGTV